MGESWMVDEEASVMMMAMISSKSPSRQGARTEFLVPELGFLVAAAKRNSSLEKRRPSVIFRSRLIYRPEERSRGCPGRLHHP